MESLLTVLLVMNCFIVCKFYDKRKCNTINDNCFCILFPLFGDDDFIGN